jgi:hypothetical protein
MRNTIRNKTSEEDAPCVTVGSLFPDGWNRYCANIIRLWNRWRFISLCSRDCGVVNVIKHWRPEDESVHIVAGCFACGWNGEMEGSSWNDGVRQGAMISVL